MDEPTLLDYYAGLAMQALIREHGDVMRIIDRDSWVNLHYHAFEHAESMMRVRKEFHNDQAQG